MFKEIGMPCWPPCFCPGQALQVAMVEDLHSAWLLLVYCAAARANFFLRLVSPGQISTFASHHDDQMWACLCTLLGIDPASVTHSSRIGATLPLRLGGLGLTSAVRLRCAAHWASWADCIWMVHQRHPIVARTNIEAVEANDPAQTAQGVVSSIDSLHTAVFDPFLGRSGRRTASSLGLAGGGSPPFPGAPSLPSISPVCPRSGRPPSHLSPSGCFFSTDCAFLSPLSTLVPVWPST